MSGRGRTRFPRFPSDHFDMYAIGGAGPSSLHAMSHAVDPQLTEEKPEPKKQACVRLTAAEIVPC